MKIHDDQQINQHDGKGQTPEQSGEGRGHGENLSANDYLRAARQIFFAVVDDRFDLAREAAEVTTLHRAVNVNHRHDVVVRDHAHFRAAAERSHAGHDFRLRRAGASDRNIFQILQAVNNVLGRLRGDVVAHSGALVEPVSGCCLKTAAKRDEHIVGHITRGIADLLRFGAIHFDVQFGLVESLLDAQVHGTGHKFQAIQQIVGKDTIGREIAPEDLDVNGSGQAEIEDLADDVRGQEVKSDAREVLGQFDAQVVHVLGGRMMILGKFSKNIGVAGADWR